jgi:hypothetical protein
MINANKIYGTYLVVSIYLGTNREGSRFISICDPSSGGIGSKLKSEMPALIIIDNSKN